MSGKMTEETCTDWCEAHYPDCKGFELANNMCHWFMDKPHGGDGKSEATCFAQIGQKSFLGWCKGGGDKQEMDGMNDHGKPTEENCRDWCEARSQCKGFEVGNNKCFWFLDNPTEGDG